MDESAYTYTPVYDPETVESLKGEFSRLHDECYLDHVGTTLYSDTQIAKVIEDLKSSLYANPHSLGSASRTTEETIERMRYRILEHFNTVPEEYTVIFTSGATASLKTVADTFEFNKAGVSSHEDSGNFVYLNDNHTSVLGMRDVIARRGAKVTCIEHNEVFEIFRQSVNIPKCDLETTSNSLFVYSAQCNFSGLKYPLSWIERIQNGALNESCNTKGTKWYVLLDAASFVATNDFNLSVYKPDFVCLSFYKMFGYPTGVGALLVRNSSADVLQKVYYGGGTVEVSLSSDMFHVKQKVLHHRFEDGTLPFLSIASLKHGFDTLSKIPSEKISRHVFSLAKYLHHTLLRLHHNNGKPLVKLYADTDYEDIRLQGGTVSFNLLRSNGEFVGYMEVLNMAALFNIHLRIGCFCNPGACQRHLKLSNKEIIENYSAGYVCGAEMDLIDGKPTGAVRISFGYMSNVEDVEKLIGMIRRCFLDGPEVSKIPVWWKEYRVMLRRKYCDDRVPILKQGGIELITDTFKERMPLKSTVDVSQREIIPQTKSLSCNEKSLTLTRLFIYPVKSCAAYEVTNSWMMGPRGLLYDREWMIVTPAGTCITQKQNIKLCLIKPNVCLKRNVLELSYPGMPRIQIPLEYLSGDTANGITCRTKVCGHRVEGNDCGAEISEWLSLALGSPGLRLLKQTKGENEIEAAKEKQLSFSSQAQFLLLNEASIEWLSDKTSNEDEFQRETALYRFRGNMIVGGCDPFEEMKWTKIRIGKNDFEVKGPCTRCQMVCIDQTTGKKTVEPLRTLAEEFHGKLRFGIYLNRMTGVKRMIKIGDTISFV